jgi:hypothetical protein
MAKLDNMSKLKLIKIRFHATASRAIITQAERPGAINTNPKRLTSPKARFFHARNLRFWTWGGPTREDGRTASEVLIYPTSILLTYQVRGWFL